MKGVLLVNLGSQIAQRNDVGDYLDEFLMDEVIDYQMV